MKKNRDNEIPDIDEYDEYTPSERGKKYNKTINHCDDGGIRKYSIHFIIIAGIIALIIGAVVTIFNGVGSNAKSETVVVRDITGMNYSEAEFRLISDGLTIRCNKEIFSSKPSGVILAQEPIKGTEVKKGRNIIVTVSKGPESTQMPDVRGMTSRGASNALNNVGIKKIKTILASYNGPSGVVIEQSPSAGSSVILDSSVVLTISRFHDDDKGKNIVPDLFGKTEKDAAADLIAADLAVQKSFDPSSKFPVGTIVGQSIKAGTQINQGMVISIVISGEDPNIDKSNEVIHQEIKDVNPQDSINNIAENDLNKAVGNQTQEELRFVPLLAGKHIAEAKKLAENADLRIGEIKFDENNDFSSLIVSSQCPEAGIWVKIGTPIDVILMPCVNGDIPAENLGSHN